MGFIFNKPKVQQPQAQQTQPVNSLRINESVEGKTIPLAWGVNRLPQFLLWTGDFNKVAHTTPSQQVGGKSGNSGTIPGQTTYTYSTAFIAGLCAGPVDHIASVWNNAGKMAANVVTDTWTVPIGGGTHRPTHPNPIRNINVGIDQTFDTGTFTDFGSGVSNRLTGSFVGTVAVAPTASSGVIGFTVDGTGPIYTAGSEFGGQTLQLSYTVNTAVAWVTEEVAITSTSFTVSNPSTFIGWSSIVGLDGSQWFGPTSSPAGVTQSHWFYADNFGNFTFFSGDIGQTVILTYQVSNSTNNSASTTLNLAFSTGEEGQPVWSWLASAHPSQAVNYSGLSTVQSSFLDLGTDTSLPQLNYEVVGQHIQAGTQDCNPQDVIYGYLTDHNFGLGFPTANIEFGFTTPQSSGVYLIVPALSAPGNNAATFWGANGFFISTVVDNQSTLADEVKTILDAGQTAMIFSEGLLKLRPYGDTTAAANGYVYQPLTQPVVDLDFDDFVADPGSDPIQVSRTNWTGAFNKVQVQFENRAGGYNPSVITAEDTASINAIGLHQEDVQDYSFIKTYSAATWASQMRVQRLANIRNTYSFTLPPIYEFIEPMDLVTITSSPMGFNKKPVRITSVEDDPEKGLLVQAEDFPYGLAQASIYPKQNNVGLHDSASTHPPGNTNVFMMETPEQLIGFEGFNVRLYASPDNIGDWGGCLVLTSFDNINYTQIGEIRTPALFGTLASSMTVGTGDPDTQSITITVPGGLQLLPSSTYDFANLQEPALFAIVDAAGTFEIVAYSNATLTATNTYSVSTFHRGLFGTGRSAHSAGATVIKLDQGYTELTYDQNQVGDTLYVLMPSFNTVGEMLQNPDTLTPLSLTLTGTYPGMFDLSAGTIALTRVSGAGTLAAKNSVDLATGDVTNKLITNVSGVVSDSLVKNGDFDLGSSGWQFISGVTGATYLSAQTGVPRGSSCLQLSSQNGSNVVVGNTDLIPVDPAKVYLFECWVKIPTPLTNGASFRPLLAEYDLNKVALPAHITGGAAFMYQQVLSSTTGNSWQYFATELTGSAATPANNFQFNSSAKYVLAGVMMVASTTTGQLGQIMGIRFSEVAAGHARAIGAIDSSKIVVPGSIDFSRSYTNKNQDHIPDGTSFGTLPLTNIAGSGTSKRALIDFTQSHVNKTIDNVSDGANYARRPNAPSNRNLFPYSGFKQWGSNDPFWTPSTWVALPGQAQSGGTAIGWLGNGSASGFPEVGCKKKPILLAPGNYTMSAYMDATQLTTSALDIGLYLTPYPGTPVAIDGGKFHLNQGFGNRSRVSTNFSLTVGTWAAGHAYNVNDLIYDSNNNLQACTTAGTSGGAHPTWSTSVNGTTTDNTATWTLLKTGTGLVPFNILIFVSNAIVNNGQYAIISDPQLEITPPSGTPTPYVENVGDDVSGSLLVDLNNTNHTALSISTNLNPQGSIIPGQAITIAISYTDTTISLSWSTQSMLRADGSTLTVNSGVANYSGLTAVTKYYIYSYVNALTGNIGFTSGSPPGTLPSTTLAMQAAFDGRFPLPVMVIQTLSSGGTGGSGTGGGGGTCPEENEFVEEQTKGIIKAIEVEIGDMIKGYSFAAGADVFRRVIGKFYQTCPAWRIVDGYKVTPCEQIYHEAEWKPAFKATGATPDTTVGYRVEITVEADEDNEHNYWLVGRTTNLLIHNGIPLPR